MKTRSIPMRFNYIRLGTEIRAAALELNLSLTEIDILAGVSVGTSSRLAAQVKSNPKMQTWLAVVNALDLDPRDFFELQG